MTDEAAGKPIRWSPHAGQRLAARDVEAEEVRLTVLDPEFVVPSVPPRRIHMRRYVDSARGRTMLTVYRTSKVRKYLRGLI